MKVKGCKITWKLTDWVQSVCQEQKLTVLNDGDVN